MFVFSVFRLLSRRCHKIFSIPQLLSCPSQNRTSGFPTYGSSVRHSVCLRPTTWVQVFADSRFRPLYPSQGLVKACPGVLLALALAVEPFEHYPCCAIDVVGTPFRVIRYGVIAWLRHPLRLPFWLPDCRSRLADYPHPGCGDTDW